MLEAGEGLSHTHATQQGSDKCGAVSAAKYSPLHEEEPSCHLISFWSKGFGTTETAGKERKQKNYSSSYEKIIRSYPNFYLI